MRLDVRSTYHAKPEDLEHFIDKHVVSVVCPTDDDWRTVAGRLAVDYLDLVGTQAQGHSICHVCDADSAGWERVYSATIEPSHDFSEIRKDFGFDDPIDGLVFIHQAVFHPALRDWQRMIIEAVCRIFPESSATVMWKGTTDMSDNELASLGFRIVAGHDMLFRPNMLRSEYESSSDGRDPRLDLQVPADAEAHVDEHWDEHDLEDYDY